MENERGIQYPPPSDHEIFAERPDLPHDPDCAYRFHGSAECTCDKDNRPESIDSLQGCRESDRIAEGLNTIGRPSGETIDITPVGLQTPEGVVRVLDAQQEWDSATHALANAVTELNWNRPDDFTKDETHQILALIGARDRKQEAFLRSVAGVNYAPPSR